ncbi:MAG: hypothetical protein MUO62_15710 [Anaerolineales bacterium]|nr:hypothetical protein [Anaerolineales bacterium]
MDLNIRLDTCPDTYQSYLLRMWKERNTGGWRASLENVSTHECHSFADVSTLFSFLFGQVDQAIMAFDPREYEPYRQKSQQTPVFQHYSIEEV